MSGAKRVDPFSRKSSRLPSKNRKQHSSSFLIQKCVEIEPLTGLKGKDILSACKAIVNNLVRYSILIVLVVAVFNLDAPAEKREDLFLQKLQQCSIIFDFSDAMVDLKSKEVKRSCLNELIEYVASEKGVLTERSYPEIIQMVPWYCFAFHLFCCGVL